jgi:hypothetical protein
VRVSTDAALTRRSLDDPKSISREHDPKRVSDADHLVVAREQASWEPLDEISGGVAVPEPT